MSLSVRILVGLGLGLFGGVLVSGNYLPVLASLPDYIEPFGKLWINAIRMTVIPLLMALLITSIAGQKSTSIVADLSRKTIGFFALMIVIGCLFTFSLAPFLLSLLTIDPDASRELLVNSSYIAANSSELPPFSDWLVGLIPPNPVQAAAENKVLPLLIFTGLLALSLLKVSAEQRKSIVSFFDALKEAMFVLIAWIMNLAPFGVFALIFPLTATVGVSVISLLGSFIAIACGLIVVMVLMLYPLAVLVGRIPLKEFIKALIPVQIIGFTTRSSLASLPATIAATEKIGVSSTISGVVLPFAVTLFKFASPMARISGTYFIAILYGIDLSVYQLLIIAMSIGLLSFYSPGIPSGGLLIMTPVYVSLGLPVAGIGILIAVDLIIDMFITLANVSANVTAAVIVSRADRSKT